jgi:hypothetical protein
VKRLEGSNLVPLSVDLPSDFVPHFIFAARDEVLYIAGIDDCLDVSELWVFLRVDPGQSEPVELGRMETEVVSGLPLRCSWTSWTSWTRTLGAEACSFTDKNIFKEPYNDFAQ